MRSLKSRTKRALLWDLLGNYGGQISSFIISIFLARLLEPEEFGLVGMSMVFIAVLQIFKDMGFASALIQSKENSSLTYSSIFYLNIVAGGILTFLLFVTAPFIGDFYENAKVTELVRLLSITFFISSFNIVQTTLLRKKLDFKSLTIRQLIGQIIAGIAAIILAFQGFGVYALVVQQIIAAVIGTLLLWRISGWYPKLEFSWKEVKRLSSFSIYVFAAQSVNQLIRQADTLIVGKLFSPATLGFYSRANSLNSLINNTSVGSLSKVFFPALASIQNDHERFEKVFLKVINIVSVISIFLTGIFYLAGEEIIILLFGEKWRPSVFIFQVLILKGFTYPISAMIVNAFMAKGKSKENFHYGNIRKVLQLTPMIFAYFYGLNAFLYALVTVSFITWIINNIFVHISLKLSFKRQIMEVLPTILIAGVLVLLIDSLNIVKLNILSVFLKLTLFSFAFLIYLKITKNQIIEEFFRLLKK